MYEIRVNHLSRNPDGQGGFTVIVVEGRHIQMSGLKDELAAWNNVTIFVDPDEYASLAAALRRAADELDMPTPPANVTAIRPAA